MTGTDLSKDAIAAAVVCPAKGAAVKAAGSKLAGHAAPDKRLRGGLLALYVVVVFFLLYQHATNFADVSRYTLGTTYTRPAASDGCLATPLDCLAPRPPRGWRSWCDTLSFPPPAYL